MTLRHLRLCRLAAVAVVLSGCAMAGPTTSAVPSREPELDLRQTTWLVTRVNTVVTPPALEAWLEIHDETVAAGSGSCGPFAGTVVFEGNLVEIDFEAERFVPCPGRDAAYRLSFLEAVAGATTYLVAGDELLLRGIAEVALRRAAPGDEDARQTWNRLRGEWRLARATVDVDVDRIPPIVFRDRAIVAEHDCGFEGRWELLDGRSIRFLELTWQIDVCADAGGRFRLVRLLTAATEVALIDEETVSIAGPGGEIVLERARD